MDKNDMIIAVVKRDKILPKDAFQGFSNISLESKILENIEFMRRGDAEENSCYKQPIGYAIVLDEENRVYAYQRASDSNYDEERLRGNWSIGIGGHIDKSESGVKDPIKASLMREISEELDFDGDILDVSVLGYINDDSNDVGKVHLGILYVVRTNAKSINPKSPESFVGELLDYESLCEREDSLENWSKMALETLKNYLDK